MHEFGRHLAKRLQPNDVVLLHGDLGAGKTTLARGIAAGLNVLAALQSPTFGLVAEYNGVTPDGLPIRIYHLDLYRLEEPEELESLGFDQFMNTEGAISVIEWPERAAHLLPDRYLLVAITYAGVDGRSVSVHWVTPQDRASVSIVSPS